MSRVMISLLLRFSATLAGINCKYMQGIAGIADLGNIEVSPLTLPIVTH